MSTQVEHSQLGDAVAELAVLSRFPVAALFIGTETRLWTSESGWRPTESPACGWPEAGGEWLATQLHWHVPVSVEGPFSVADGLLWLIVGADCTPDDSGVVLAAARWLGRWIAEANTRRSLERNLGQALEDFQALAEIGAVTTSRLDLESVLGNIIDTVGRILNVESGGCLLYDPDTNHLVLQKPAFGVCDEELIGCYRVPADGNSNAALVFRSGVPYVSNAAREDPRLVQQFIRLYQTRSTITVPLQIGNLRIGVFHVINKRDGDFADRDLRLMELIASQLAVSIHNAHLYEALRVQYEQLSRIQTIANRLTQKVLGGASIVEILRVLAEVLRGAVLLVAPTGLVEGRAAPPEIEQVPWDELEKSAHRVAANRKVMDATIWSESLSVGDRSVAILGTAIGSGRHTYAHLCVAFFHTTPGPVEHQAVEQAATALALEFLRQRDTWDVEQRLKGSLVEDLLTDRNLAPAEARRRAAYAGINLDQAMRVAVVEWGPESADSTSQLSVKTLRDICQLVSFWWPRVLASQIDNRIVLLIPEPAAGPEGAKGDKADPAAAVLQGLVRQCQTQSAPLIDRAGVGRIARGLEKLRASYRDALDCLEALRHFGGERRLLRYENLGVAGLLLRMVDGDEVGHFVRRTLDPLLDPETYGSDLLETLRQFLTAEGNRLLAAQRLHVHINTVNYRLRKVEELTGLSVDRPSDLTQLNLACMLHRLGGRAPA